MGKLFFIGEIVIIVETGNVIDKRDCRLAARKLSLYAVPTHMLHKRWYF